MIGVGDFLTHFSPTGLNYGIIHPRSIELHTKSMENVVSIEELLSLAGQLSLLDKVRLLEHIAPQITQDLVTSEVTPRKSLLGVWRGLDTIEAEIAEARREMWTNFPRRGG